MWVEGQFHGQGTLYNENPQTLCHPFDCKDFDEVEDYWMAYSGTFYSIKAILLRIASVEKVV